MAMSFLQWCALPASFLSHQAWVSTGLAGLWGTAQHSSWLAASTLPPEGVYHQQADIGMEDKVSQRKGFPGLPGPTLRTLATWTQLLVFCQAMRSIANDFILLLWQKLSACDPSLDNLRNPTPWLHWLVQGKSSWLVQSSQSLLLGFYRLKETVQRGPLNIFSPPSWMI